MASTNGPLKCSGCDCSFEPKATAEFLTIFFPSEISLLITHKMNSSSTYRVMHSTPNGGVHALCPDCEEWQEDLMCRMDTGAFTCPHAGCRRYIIAG